jgi:inhibitor of cysteine peptidase
MSEIEVREDETERKVTVPPGDTFDVVIDENPTTGFRWQLTAPGGGGVRLRAEEYEKGGDGMGAGGRRRFLFQAGDNPGEAHLEFKLSRPWESVEPRRHVRVHVTIG